LCKQIESEISVRNNAILTKEEQLQRLTQENNELKLLRSSNYDDIEEYKIKINQLENEYYELDLMYKKTQSLLEEKEFKFIQLNVRNIL